VPDVGGHIFVSYGWRNRRYVADLAAYLANAGFEAWWEQELRETGELGARDGTESRIRAAIADSAAVILVLSPSAVSSQRVRSEISHAVHLRKPIVRVLLEPYPPEEMAEFADASPLEDVTGERMPSPSFVDRLATVSMTTQPPKSPSTAELIARYAPSQPSTPSPEPVVTDPKTSALDAPATVLAIDPEPMQVARRRIGARLLPAVGVAAALVLVWLLADWLPDTPRAQSVPPVVPATSPASALTAFIAAVEGRDGESVWYHTCARYQGVAWFESDFYASDFIQAKIALIQSDGESATANLELHFQVDRLPRITGRQYRLVAEGGGWKVCGPA
jgi:hypothetical protein